LQNYARELLASEENLSVTLDSIGDAVITTDAAGKVQKMNPVAELLTGWSSGAAFNQPLDNVFHIVNSQTGNAAPNPVYQVFKSGNIVGLANHTSLIAKDGREYHIADSAAPIRNKSGQIDGVILVFHDVSEQYRKQALIAAQEAELRKITNILPGPVSHVDLDGRYLFVSAAYENWFGKRAQDVVGLTHLEAIGAELYAKFEPYFKRALAGEQLTAELTLPYPAEGTRDVILNVIPDFDSNGGVCGYFTIVTDITERKLAEQTALRLREQLAQANKMESVGHLTAGIAHDFNNILGAILGYTELSQLAIENSKPDRAGLYLAEILKANLRAKELIAQMLAFSRLEPAMQTGPAPVTLLAHVIQEVVSLLRSSIPSSIDINYRIEEAGLKGSIEAVRLHQILLNLGINARDAVGEYGKIDIVLSAKKDFRQICASCQQHFDGDFIRLSVRDTGCGIPAQIQDKIFDPFYTTKGVGKGTGMGLSVVHGLVHASGGHIQVESVVGHGTTISILLPLFDSGMADPPAPSAVTALPTQTASLAGLRIMVVDDERSMAAVLHEFFILQGALPVSFSSALDALRAFEASPDSVDIVVSDETMPGLSGMHMAARMLKLRPALPIILCTGFSENATAELANKAGLAGFFYKPLQLNELLRKIQEIMLKKH
jgi:PAS domain S-box-containing protein